MSAPTPIPRTDDLERQVAATAEAYLPPEHRSDFVVLCRHLPPEWVRSLLAALTAAYALGRAQR